MTATDVTDTHIKRKRHCVFSTGNDAYVSRAVVSLLSFAKFNPDFDMFLLCSELSDESKQLCAYCGVTPVELDLSGAFYRQWRYPKECYYHFKGPELFLSMGYDYSLYLDGDTYCNGRFPREPN